MSASNAACIVRDRQLAVVIDDDLNVRQIIETTLQQLGMMVESFPAAKEAFESIDTCEPAIIFLDVALLRSDAIDVLRGLGERHYGGVVQLMSGGRPSLLEAVARIGVRCGLTLARPLNKPLAREAIAQAVEVLRSDMPTWSDQAAPRLPPANGGQSH
jgi:DNA-binding NtrC family response regulator